MPLTPTRTAAEIAAEVFALNAKTRPNLKLAVNLHQNMVGMWSDERGRYVAFAALALTGEWVLMPYEIKVNGELLAPGDSWQPVPTPGNS